MGWHPTGLTSRFRMTFVNAERYWASSDFLMEISEELSFEVDPTESVCADEGSWDQGSD